MAELEALEQGELDEQLLDESSVGDSLPSIPSSEPVTFKRGLSVVLIVFMPPNKIWGIIKSDRPSVCPFVRSFVRPFRFFSFSQRYAI